MIARSLSSFDPGAQHPRRWNAAIEDAQAEMVKGAFVLVVDVSPVFAERVTLTTRMVIQGVDETATRLSWSTVGDAGIRITPASARSSIERVTCVGPSPWVGSDIGIEIGGGLCSLRSVRVENWGRAGLAVIGDTNANTNANGGFYERVIASLCGHGNAQAGAPHHDGAGILCDGGDSNGGVFMACAAYDCRKGILDSSFLGNAWSGCLAEGCNDRFDAGVGVPFGCGFMTDDPNCRASFFGCYTESDSPGRVNAPSMIVGGLFANYGSAIVLGGHGATQRFPLRNFYVDAAQRALTAHSELGGDGGAALSLSVSDSTTGADVALPHRLRHESGWWAMNFANLTRADAFRFQGSQFWIPNALHLGGNGSASGMRISVQSLASAQASGPQDGGQWAIGDRIMPREVVAGGPCEYVYTASGWRVCARAEVL